jgi:hypothetical protein
MITNLLAQSKTKPTSYKLTFFMAAFMTIFGVNANAQCVGPYQIFESTPSTTAPLTASGWTFNSLNIGTATTTAYSGSRSIVLNSAVDFLQTPLITNASTFSFYYKSTAASWSFKVEYSAVANFSSGVTSLGTFSAAAPTNNPAENGFLQFSNSIPANNYVRITGNSTGVVFVDDHYVASVVASDNTIIVPKRYSTVACTVNLIAGMTYTLYDNGGFSDNYSAGQSALNDIILKPASGEQVELTFTSFNTGATSNGDLSLTNTTPTLTDYTANNTIPNSGGGGVYLATAADVNVGVNFESTGNNSGYIVTVKSRPPVATCSDVTLVGITASSISATSANVFFTPPGTGASGGYDYYYSTVNTAPTSGTTPTGNGSSSPITMTGFASNTVYYTWVRSNCGGTKGNWVQASGSFTTKCTAYPIPYLENFNGLNGPLPTCTSADDSSWATNITNGNLFGYVQGSSFFTKPVTLSAGTVYRLSYDYSTINGVADFDVAYGTTNFTPTSSNINIWLNTHSGISTLAANVINFTPASTATYYVGYTLQGVDTPGTTQFNLDNISIEVETCFPPTALTVPFATITATSATLNWSPPASVPSNGYQYYVSTSSAVPEYSTPPTGSVASGNTAVLSGLTSGTIYYVWVRSNCSGKYSVWSSYVQFTTTVVVVTTVVMHSGSNIEGQTFPFNDLNNNAAGICNMYNFFDSNANGTTAGNYANNENFTYTFKPVAGKKMKVVFSTFATEANYDGLSIYNGNSTASPLISSGLPAGFDAVNCPAGSFYGTSSPGTIISTAADGSLTFKFTSDYIITRAGWSATVTCVTTPVITSFTPTNNACLPNTTVTITGSNFLGAGVPAITGVFFNGIAAASYSVVNATTITAVLPAGSTSGVITVTNAESTGYSASAFSTYLPAPVTTGVTICVGAASAPLTTSATCQGYINAGNTLSGTWTAGSDPTAPRPQSSTNSATCSFNPSIRNYVAINFQVSASGLYNFTMTSGVDGMGYISSGAFTPGTCSTGFVIGDDDSGPGLEPLISVNLVAGVTYTLYSTTYGSTASISGAFSWAVNSPTSGQIMLFSNQQMAWYTVAVGGTAIGTGPSFNPVGVASSGLANTNTAGTYNYYAGCPSNPNCRTLTTFVINPLPVAGTVSANQTICSGTQPVNISVSGSTGTIQWQSSPDGITYSNIATATSATLPGTTVGSLTSTKYFQAVLTSGSCGSVTSAVVTVAVTPVSVAGTVSANQIICPANQPADITLSGYNGTIQWQSSSDNVTFANISGATGATLAGTTVGPLAATTYFHAIVTNGVCPPVTSPAVTVTVTAAVGGNITPLSQTSCSTLSNLTVAGYTGAISKWQWSTDAGFTIPNDIPSSASATLTTTQIGAFSGTRYYRTVVTSGTCTAYPPVANITYSGTTWNGTWSNGVPNSATAAIFTADYAVPGTLNACSVLITAGNVVFNAGDNLVVQNAVVRTGGTLTFNDDSSLVQVNDAAVNSGSITYKRNAMNMRSYDYTYWSSPLSPQTLVGLSPLTLSDKYFRFDTALNNYVNVPANSLMNSAKGYIIRAPQGYTSTPAPFTGIFNGGANDGVPNNGIITIPIVVAGANNMNLIGNPYPSAIDADLFITDPSNVNVVDATIYLWTHNTTITSNQYTGSDYAIYNLNGGVGTAAATNPGVNTNVPNGNIATGQGFFIKGKNTGGNATFRNSMRLIGSNDQFFRVSNTTMLNIEKHRVWLEVTNDQGAYKQTLVGYIQGATDDRDRDFDGDLVEAGNVVALYSLLGAEKLSIQGKALPFHIEDQVPLGFRAAIAGSYVISLSNFDGLFNSQNVYLEDAVTGMIQNLKSGSYSFTTSPGTFDDRFILRFTDGTALGTGAEVFTENSVVVYKNETGVHISTSNVTMDSVKILDIRGRVIDTKQNISASETVFTNLPETQQVLLVRVVSENGAVVTKKLIH